MATPTAYPDHRSWGELPAYLQQTYLHFVQAEKEHQGEVRPA